MIKFWLFIFIKNTIEMMCPSQFILSIATWGPFVPLLVMLTIIFWPMCPQSRDTVELCKDSISHHFSFLLTDFTIYWRFLPEIIITLLFDKCWLSIFLIYYRFTCWNSTQPKSSLFFVHSFIHTFIHLHQYGLIESYFHL